MLAAFAKRHDLRRFEILFSALAGLLFFLVLRTETHIFAAVASGYLLFTMLLVTLIDSRLMIIPNVFSLPAIPLGLAAAATAFPQDWRLVLLDHAGAAVVASLSLYGLRWFYFRTRGVTGLGLGDVKLAAAAGAWVGLELLPATCLLATGAALAAVVLRRLTAPAKVITMATAIPFGSFIAPAIVIVWGMLLLGP